MEELRWGAQLSRSKKTSCRLPGSDVECQGRGKDKHKGSRTDVCCVCLRNWEEAGVAGAMSINGQMMLWLLLQEMSSSKLPSRTVWRRNVLRVQICLSAFQEAMLGQ